MSVKNETPILTSGLTGSPNILVRRHFMATAGAAVAGIFVPFSKSEAASLFGSASDLGIEERFIQHFGTSVLEYGKEIKSWRLRNISINQLIAPHAKVHGSVHNSLPPREMWSGMRATMKAVDHIIYASKAPLKEIVSAYRSPAYNRTCPGARSGSYHQKNVAVDIVLQDSPSRTCQAARILRSRGLFKGGVGSYRGFTHVDTRGMNVDW